MKKFIIALLFFCFSVSSASAANIALTSSEESSALGMATYTVVLTLTAAADGSGSFNFASDGSGALAGLFTTRRPGTILTIIATLGTGSDTPTTLFDVQLFDGTSALKEDLLRTTGTNLAITETIRLFIQSLAGTAVYSPLTTPPVLTISNAGSGKKITFTFIIAQ